MQNANVKQQGLSSLRLERALLSNIIGHHDEDEVNVADSTLRCRSYFLERFLKHTTL